MERKYGDFYISNDGTQWIVQKEYVGKDKDDNDKLMRSPKSYFSKIESLVKHINHSELLDIFNERQKNMFDEMQILGIFN